MEYLICFFLSCLTIKFIEKYEKKSLNFLAGSAIAILFPCLLAGLRDVSIGTDVEGYAKPLFIIAENSMALEGYLKSKYLYLYIVKFVTDFEIGFSLIVYIVTKIFHSFIIELFVIQLFIIVPVYKSLVYFKGKFPIWFGMAVFYLMYYNTSLNMMRQWIAMAFLLYGFHFILENKYILYFVTIGFAMLFHKSALIGIVVFILYQYMNSAIFENIKISIKSGKYNSTIIRLLLILFIGLVLLCGLNNLYYLFSELPFLSGYAQYISGNVKFSINQIIVRIPIIILFVCNWEKIKKEKRLGCFLLSALIMDLIISQLVNVSFGQSGRIALYFGCYNIFSLPLIYTSIENRQKKIFIKDLLIIYLFFYWWFYYVYKNVSETYPYQWTRFFNL